MYGSISSWVLDCHRKIDDQLLISSSSLQIIIISDIKLEEQSPVSRALYLQTESTSHQSQNINIDIKLKRERAPITRHKETFQCNWRTSKGQKRERERKSLCKDIPQKNTNSNDAQRERGNRIHQQLHCDSPFPLSSSSLSPSTPSLQRLQNNTDISPPPFHIAHISALSVS